MQARRPSFPLPCSPHLSPLRCVASESRFPPASCSPETADPSPITCVLCPYIVADPPQVHVIYEPPQEGEVDCVRVLRNEDEENRVNFIMEQLGRAETH